MESAKCGPLIDSTTSLSGGDNSLQEVAQRLLHYNNSLSLHTSRASSIAPTVEYTSSYSREIEVAAAYACADHAQVLGYDLIYAVEIKPARHFMSEEELQAPYGLRMEVLAAYGQIQTFTLNSSLHLRALRNRGGERWTDSAGTKQSKGEFESGQLIPIHSEGGVRRDRRSGIILGAFRKPRRAFTGESMGAAAETERLVAFAQLLKDILVQKDRKQMRLNTERSSTERSNLERSNRERSSTERSSTERSSMERSNMERSSTERSNTERSNAERAFPANEAREVEFRTQSFDISRNRQY
jgi:hypothetical protein